MCVNSFLLWNLTLEKLLHNFLYFQNISFNQCHIYIYFFPLNYLIDFFFQKKKLIKKMSKGFRHFVNV